MELRILFLREFRYRRKLSLRIALVPKSHQLDPSAVQSIPLEDVQTPMVECESICQTRVATNLEGTHVE